jgi:hypothetical protein
MHHQGPVGWHCALAACAAATPATPNTLLFDLLAVIFFTLVPLPVCDNHRLRLCSLPNLAMVDSSIRGTSTVTKQQQQQQQQ